MSTGASYFTKAAKTAKGPNYKASKMVYMVKTKNLNYEFSGIFSTYAKALKAIRDFSTSIYDIVGSKKRGDYAKTPLILDPKASFGNHVEFVLAQPGSDKVRFIIEGHIFDAKGPIQQEAKPLVEYNIH